MRRRTAVPYATSYLADAPEPPPPMAAGPDATREFAAKLENPARWVIKQGVPIFKSHERTDPATGQLIKVDLPKLYRIAANMQRLERQGGVPIRMTLGHTEPGKPEIQQPPVAGYYKNARVQPFGPNGEPAIVVDEWLDPQYQGARKNYPYRSSEYYDDAEQITGVALLTRDPYLDLGVVAYERGDTLVCYTVGAQPDRRTDYARAGGRTPVLYHLVLGEVPMFDQHGQPVQGWLPAQPQAGAPAQPQYPQYAPGTSAPQPQVQWTGYVEPSQTVTGPSPQQPVQPQAPNPTPYSAPWPGPAYQRPTMHREHPNTGAIYSNQGGQRPRPYGASNILGGAAGGAALGGMMGGPPGAIAGGLMGGGAGAVLNSRTPRNARYASSGRRGRGFRYEGEEDMSGPPQGPMAGPADGGGPPGDPLQQLQMLLMAAVEVLGQVTGGAPGMGPEGPPPTEAPQTPFPPEGEEGRGDQPYSRYAGGAGRPPGRGRYGRYSAEETQMNRYPQRRPTPYGAPAAPPPRTLSGRPVGESIELAKVNYQLEQQGHVIRMLAYERDQADTQACVEAIQRLADQGYPVTDYEVNELKAKPREQRAGYLQHITTKYQKIGTEQLPPLLGDPTPAGADPRLNQPTTKEEMEQALQIMAASGSSDATAYNRALEQVRYARVHGGAVPVAPAPYATPYPAPQPSYGPPPAPQGPADQYPQYGFPAGFQPNPNPYAG